MISDEENDYYYSSGDEEYDYMEDDDYDTVEWNTIQNTSHFQQPKVSFMPAKDLLPEMKDRLIDIAEALDVPESAAAILLREHSWSNQNLLEAYSNGPNEVKRKCGVNYRCTPSKIHASDGEAGSCPICYETMESNSGNSLKMPCGHQFCIECWHDYCVHEIASGPSCIIGTCPDSTCKEALTEEEIKICAPELLQKFQNFQLRNYVEVNPKTRWCPGRGCEQIACAQGTLNENVVECNSCLTTFCIACGEEPHDPCGCKQLARWNEKCRNDSETANWMTVNTKNCPKCSTRIHKDGGCMFVSCSKCKHGFCWVCMGSHHVWDCNKVPEESIDKTQAQNELDRYLHYYNRYDSHAKSQEFTLKQIEKVELLDAQFDVNLAENSVWQDVTFLKDANKQLVQCHRVLKYTFVFAYYYFLDPSTKIQRQHFEHHQGVLQNLTEELAQSSEKPLAEIDSAHLKNQTRVIGRYVKNLLSFIDNELEHLDNVK